MIFVYEYVCGLNQDKHDKIKTISYKIYNCVSKYTPSEIKQRTLWEKSNISNKQRKVPRIYKELLQISKHTNKTMRKTQEVFKRSSIISLSGHQYPRTLLV